MKRFLGLLPISLRIIRSAAASGADRLIRGGNCLTVLVTHSLLFGQGVLLVAAEALSSARVVEPDGSLGAFEVLLNQFRLVFDLKDLSVVIGVVIGAGVPVISCMLLLLNYLLCNLMS